MKKIDLPEIKKKTIAFLKHAGRVIVIVAALIVGFSAGEIYRAYKVGTASTKMPQVQKIDMTSVAINDRGELMIIDRGSGKYLLFQDEVGQSIFNQYASRIYLRKQGAEPKSEQSGTKNQ